MWIGWVESNVRNPSVKVLEDLDNPFKRIDDAKLCMSPSLNGTLPEYVISQEDNFPLTLYTDLQQQQKSWISIVLSIKFNHKFMQISDLTYISMKEEGKCISMKSEMLWGEMCTVPQNSCTVLTSHILEECHLRGRHTQD